MGQYGRYSSTDYLKSVPQTILSLAELKQRGKIAGERTAILGRQADTSAGHLKLAEKKHVAELQKTPVPERVMTEEQVGGTMGMFPGTGEPSGEAVPKISTPEALTPLTPGMIAAQGAQLENFEKDTGISGLSKSMGPYTNFVKGLTDQGYNRHQIYLTSTDLWDRFKENPLVAVKKAMVKADAEGDKALGAKLQKIYDGFDSGEVLDSVFSASKRYEDALQAAKIKDETLPKTFEAGLVKHHIKDPKKLEEFYKYMTKAKGSKASRFPDRIKASLDMVKLLTKNQPTLQEQIMAGFMKSIPGMEQLDVSGGELSDDDKVMLKGALKNISEFLKIKIPKSKPDPDAGKPSWKDYK